MAIQFTRQFINILQTRLGIIKTTESVNRFDNRAVYATAEIDREILHNTFFSGARGNAGFVNLNYEVNIFQALNSQAQDGLVVDANLYDQFHLDWVSVDIINGSGVNPETYSIELAIEASGANTEIILGSETLAVGEQRFADFRNIGLHFPIDLKATSPAANESPPLCERLSLEIVRAGAAPSAYFVLLGGRARVRGLGLRNSSTITVSP